MGKTFFKSMNNSRAEQREISRLKASWEKEEDITIDKLFIYLHTVNLPVGTIKLSDSIRIFDAKLFVKNHISFIKSNLNAPFFKPYFKRLKLFQKLIECM